MRVVVCPDEFAGTLTAAEAAAAIGRGWRSARPDDDVVEKPLADGGPGFLDALHIGLGGQLHTIVVQDPLGRPVEATWLEVAGIGYIEAAQANGLHLVSPEERDPADSDTTGVGQLIAAAADMDRIVVGLGGSATNDGGRGAVGFLAGRALPEILIATDVDSPLLGPHGATYGFGRQKGAGEQDLPLLELHLIDWSRRAPDLAEQPGAGAAGGLGFGLMLLGGRRVSGAGLVLDVVDLPDEFAKADLVITGEGRLDWQSLHGKVVGSVITASTAPVIVMAGDVELEDPTVRSYSMAATFGRDEALSRAAECLTKLAETVSRG